MKEETKRKISAALRGKPKSRKHREHIARSMKGKKHTQKTKRAISEGLRLYHKLTEGGVL